jgi:alkylated DNA repair dioxygenase AlkB
MVRSQVAMFKANPRLPEGFKYQPEVISADQEAEVVQRLRELPLKEFVFQGFLAKRRTVSFGWHYDFNERALQKADDIPGFLVDLRERAAEFAGMAPERFQHVLVIEYQPGASIGWHRDKNVFGEIIGVSLLSPCRFRLRRKTGSTWERVSFTAEPRSAYLMSGPSRTEWEHSIPAVDALRYSVTFRNLRESR